MAEGPVREQTVLLLDSLCGKATEEFSFTLLNQQLKQIQGDVHAASWGDGRTPRKKQQLMGLGPLCSALPHSVIA